MESYQEKILKKYHSFEAVKDCFTISRLDGEITSLTRAAAFNEQPRKDLEDKYKELEEILKKYKDAL